ncbi:hypothetical protein WJX73_006891 [Symbiochloris irregularis]|uniref:Secreted protein n=1 Tax=Symbiochloris irregularis TaxID=706552 RepID=A0AAW1P461_9CHLO
MRFRLHSASLAIVVFTACLSLASAKECWVGEEKDSCLLYLGAEDISKCAQLQMAFGARAPAYTITSPSRPCLALLPRACTSLELPQCHTFEATQAMEALGEPLQPEEVVVRRMPQQLAPAQAWQCYVTDANECLMDPVAVSDTDTDSQAACDALHGDGQWDTCIFLGG